MADATGKAALRRRLRQMLASLPDELVDGWSSAAVSRLTELQLWRDAASIHTYVGSLPGEVRTSGLILRALDDRKSVVCPRIRPHGQLDHHDVTSLSQLSVGAFGVRQPDPQLAPPADTAATDLIIVPGVGFSLDGSRLGLGGGYYDRLLTSHDAPRVALAFECQIANALPQAAHDQRVNLIVTELRVIQCP